MAINFKSIVDNLQGENPKHCQSDFADYSAVHCPDQIVKWKEFGSQNFERETIVISDQILPGRRAIIVLESPHIDEFQHAETSWIPIGPANGNTGARIRKYIQEILAELGVKGITSFVLVNAVQYQCSLAISPIKRSLTDEIFSACWRNGGDVDFRNRIRNYYKPGDFLVNACTGRKNQKFPLKMLIEEALIDEFRSELGTPLNFDWGRPRRAISHLGIRHPSTWWKADNRKAIWSTGAAARPKAAPDRVPAATTARAALLSPPPLVAAASGRADTGGTPRHGRRGPTRR
jgi:hypothetical protein